MNRKIKILSTVVAMALLIAVIGISVFAAIQTTGAVNNDVSFRATDVPVTVTGNVYYTKYSDGTQLEKIGETYTASNHSNDGRTNTGVLDTWTIASIDLDYENEGVQYELTITNNGNYAATVNYTNTSVSTQLGRQLAIKNYNLITEEYDMSYSDNNEEIFTIAPQCSATIIVRYSILDFSKDFSKVATNFSFSIVRA